MDHLKPLVLAAAMLVPAIASADTHVEEHRTVRDSGAFRANYALRDVPDGVGRTHGFGLGFKLYTTETGTREVNGRVHDIDLDYSGELAFDGTFGDRRNMFALGFLGGSGAYTPGAEGALELTGTFLRAAIITNPNQVVWNPCVGLELKLGPLTATPSLQGYVGSTVKGVGFGLNTGFSF